MMNSMEQNDLVPYPGISLLQHSFSPAVFVLTVNENAQQEKNEYIFLDLNLNSNSKKDLAFDHFTKNEKLNFSTAQAAHDSIFIPIMHKRQSEKITCVAMALQFFGDVLPKDIMSAIGALKTKRNLEFVDWCRTGFKCSSEYSNEKAFSVSIPRSCHVIANCIDALAFYQRMDFVVNDGLSAKVFEKSKVFTHYNGQQVDFLHEWNSESFDEIKEFVCAKYADYNEMYSPTEEQNEENDQ